ncbi:MAG: hypothetical protein K0R54_817 [Clostridiaceae bacterium]|jgi:hypothetical protein|nr:hypothetical protein [Clostridiaceae bacterium]
MFVRYELYCENEKQDVGLLMGVNELDLDDEQKEILLNDFNENLIVPEFYMHSRPRKNVLAFFTNEGLSFFEESINKIIEKFDNHGLFQIAKITISEHNQKIIYQDNFQVLIENAKDINITI